MYEVEKKIEMLASKELWEKGIQHCIDKGVSSVQMIPFTYPEKRVEILETMLAGKYRIAPPRISLIPKGNEEFRKVYVNTLQDRLVLTMINEVYCSLYSDMIHPKCVSYRKGIGVKNIVQSISHECLRSKGYKIDISKYFDSVSREAMNAALKSVDTGSCLDQILYDYYNDDIVVDENWQVIHKYKSLCQGCAPSAFFANILLHDVDEVLSKICDVYYRYSDDILILGKRADEALEILTAMLAKKGLSINPKKVKPIDANTGFTFLGCMIKGNEITLDEKSLKNFMEQMKQRRKSNESLKKTIKRINRYLYLDYLDNPAKFGWAEYFFSIINREEDIILLDEWLKDYLRGCYTGKGKIGGLGLDLNRGVVRGKGKNVRANLQKTEGLLQKNGYMSMHHLYKVYKIDHDAYRMEITRSV